MAWLPRNRPTDLARRRRLSALLSGGGGAPGLSGDLVLTDITDSSSVSASADVTGTLALIDSQDLASSNASADVTGTLALIDQLDTASVPAAASVDGALTIGEPADTLISSASAVGTLSGALSVTELNDTLALAASAGVGATLSTSDDVAVAGPLITPGNIYIFGNSLSTPEAGNYSLTNASSGIAYRFPTVTMVPHSTGGVDTPDLISTYTASVSSVINPGDWCLIWEGVNDLDTTDAATAYAHYETFSSLVHADGGKVMLLGCLPYDFTVESQEEVDALNDLLVADHDFVDSWIDLDTDLPQFRPPGSTVNDNFGDIIHLSDKGRLAVLDRVSAELTLVWGVRSNDTTLSAATVTVTALSAENDPVDVASGAGSLTAAATHSTVDTGDTLASAGSVGASLTGGLIVTDATDASSAIGTANVDGTLVFADAQDTSAVVGLAAVDGTLALADSLDAAVVVGFASADGVLAITEPLDSFSAYAAVGSNLFADLIAIDPSDTSLAIGAMTVDGTFTLVDIPDSSLVVGVAAADGSLTIPDVPDASAMVGASIVDGALTIAELPDVLSAYASANSTNINGALTATDQSDVSAAIGTVSADGALSFSDPSDPLSAYGTAGSSLAGVLSTTDQTDSSAVVGSISIDGGGTATDSADYSSVVGAANTNCESASVDVQDAASCSVSADVGGTLVVTDPEDNAPVVVVPISTPLTPNNLSGGAYGSMGYGSGPIGSSEDISLDFSHVIVRASNELWIVVFGFTGLPEYSPLSDQNVKNWKVQPVNVGGFPRLVQSIELVDTASAAARVGAASHFKHGLVPAVRVITDGPLSPGQQYIVAYRGVNVESSYFTALSVEPLAIETTAAQDAGTIEDFKNPQLARDKLPLGQLGSYNITDDGDLGIDDGLASLRKRILRRITTAVSGFYHLPNYGTELENKANLTPDLARRIRERVTSGVNKEPDVLTSTTRVYAVTGEDGMVVVQVTATTRFGQTVSVSEQVSVNG